MLARVAERVRLGESAGFAEAFDFRRDREGADRNIQVVAQVPRCERAGTAVVAP